VLLLKFQPKEKKEEVPSPPAMEFVQTKGQGATIRNAVSVPLILERRGKKKKKEGMAPTVSRLPAINLEKKKGGVGGDFRGWGAGGLSAR